MDYKSLIDFSNGLVVSVIDSMVQMGLELPLIWTQMSESFNSKAKDMLKDAGIELKGETVKEITEDFVKSFKSAGICQRAEILEISDSKIILDLGECILSPATMVLRNKDPEFIPPCPMTAILAGKIEEKTKKQVSIDACKWKPEMNTSIFTINLE